MRLDSIVRLTVNRRVDAVKTRNLTFVSYHS